MRDNVALVVLLQQLSAAQQAAIDKAPKLQQQEQHGQQQHNQQQPRLQGAPKRKTKVGKATSKTDTDKLQKNSLSTEDTGSGVEDDSNAEVRRMWRAEQQLQQQQQEDQQEDQHQQPIKQEPNEDKRSRQQQLAELLPGDRISAGSPNPQPRKRLRPGAGEVDHATSAAAVACAPGDVPADVLQPDQDNSTAAQAGPSTAAEQKEGILDAEAAAAEQSAPADTSASTPLLAVGNTHVLFNIKRGDIKLGQLRLLLESMVHAAQHKAPGRDVLNVITGDFNAAPHSPVSNSGCVSCAVSGGGLGCMLCRLITRFTARKAPHGREVLSCIPKA